jgi:hypothetical protein
MESLDGINLEDVYKTPNFCHTCQLRFGTRGFCLKAQLEIYLITSNVDHIDYFYVNDQDGWKKLVLPNDAEIKECSRGQELRGLITVCFAYNNLRGNLAAKDISETTTEIQVNGEPVVGFTNVMNCEFLRASQGHYWTPSSDSRFEIRARKIQPNTFLCIGAL